MKKTADIPQILVVEDGDSGEFTLYASSYGTILPAGERLFRAPPIPAIRFRHESRADAEVDAGKLREYLAVAWSGVGAKKKGAGRD